MKRILCIMLLLLASCAAPPVAAQDDVTAAAQVTVTEVALSPEVFMRDDVGTVTIAITNNGVLPVNIQRVTLRDNVISVLDDDTYSSVGSLGAGNSLLFTFTVRADANDGIYYPKFNVDYPSAPSLRYRIPLKVESTDLQVSVIEKPDSFSEGKKETIRLLVGNPRENTVNGVTVTPLGEGLDSTQSSYFIGTLTPDQSAEVAFEITPRETTDLTFHTTYRNGLNEHNTDLTIPLSLGDGKRAADLLLNNLIVTNEVGYLRLTGDVTNAGLESAKAVVVTTSTPAVPVDPNRLYVVGALDPDDFSSFEVTFEAEGEDTIPVIIEYKDDDGNLFSKSVEVGIEGSTGTEDQEEFPLIYFGVIALVIIIIGGVIFYSWKKK